MNTFQDIDLLLETKMKTDKAIAEYADTLRIQLSRLDSAGRPQQKSKVAGATRFSAVVRRLRTAVSVLPSNSYLLTPLFCILIGIAVGYCVHYLPSITQDKPPAVIPATETLEEFVAREASRLLTTD